MAATSELEISQPHTDNVQMCARPDVGCELGAVAASHVRCRGTVDMTCSAGTMRWIVVVCLYDMTCCVCVYDDIGYLCVVLWCR